MLKRMLQTDYFRLVVVEDAVTVEICGALKVNLSKLTSEQSTLVNTGKSRNPLKYPQSLAPLWVWG